MSEATFDQVYGVLIDALTGLVGEAYVEEMEVGPASRFEADVDFVAWFADMELEQLVDLSIGDVVEFIVASLSAPRPAGAGAGS